jgi:hypothetical protein
MDEAENKNVLKKYGPTTYDMVFMGFLVLAMLGVAWVGHLAYQEGMKTEVTKRNGETWAKWFTQANLDRGKVGYEPNECATGLVSVSPNLTPVAVLVEPVSEVNFEAKYEYRTPVPSNLPPAPRTWGPCLKVLTVAGGPLSENLNPFSKKPLTLVAKCDMADRGLAGTMALEKTLPTPAGSAIPFTTSPLTESDPIDQKMQLRITMCDKGAYPIRIAELEF